MKTYEVLEAGFLAGEHHAVGDRVQMTPKAAKYFLPPYANRLREIQASAPGDTSVGAGNSPAGSRPFAPSRRSRATANAPSGRLAAGESEGAN